MANRNIKRIVKPRADIISNMGSGKVAIEEDNQKNFVYKDGDGNLHSTANLGETGAFSSVVDPNLAGAGLLAADSNGKIIPTNLTTSVDSLPAQSVTYSNAIYPSVTNVKGALDNVVERGLAGLTGVNTTGVSDGDALIYDEDNGEWVAGNAESVVDIDDTYVAYGGGNGITGSSAFTFDNGSDTMTVTNINAETVSSTSANINTITATSLDLSTIEAASIEATASVTSPILNASSYLKIDADTPANVAGAISYQSNRFRGYDGTSLKYLDIDTFDGMTDTNFTSLANNHIAYYNNATSKWLNMEGGAAIRSFGGVTGTPVENEVLVGGSSGQTVSTSDLKVTTDSVKFGDATTSDETDFDFYKGAGVEAFKIRSSEASNFIMHSYNTTNDACNIVLRKTHANINDSLHLSTVDGEELGSITFQGRTSILGGGVYNVAPGASIQAIQTSGATSGGAPTDLVFSTHNGTSTPEAFRIDRLGNIRINEATVDSAGSGVLSIKETPSQPTDAPADCVQIYAVNSSNSKATLAIYADEDVSTSTSFSQSHRIIIKVNGTEYYLPLQEV